MASASSAFGFAHAARSLRRTHTPFRLGQVVEDVAFLVYSTPSDDGVFAEDVAHRTMQRLGAVEDEQHALCRVQAAVARREAVRPRTTVAFSVEPSMMPRGTLVPSTVTQSAPTMV